MGILNLCRRRERGIENKKENAEVATSRKEMFVLRSRTTQTKLWKTK